MHWAKTPARGYKKHLNFLIWCDLYWRFYGRYSCIQSTTCKAYNYDTRERTCTQLLSPCPLAFANTMMEFMVFTDKPVHQCYQWIPYSSGDTIDSRMISTDDNVRLICRMSIPGGDIVCYFHTMMMNCFGSWGGAIIQMSDGYLCERLRIVEDSTVFWVPCTAGDPIHPRAVVSGHMANGNAVYVTKFDANISPIRNLAGYYVQGEDFTIGEFFGTQLSSSMMMMIVL